MPRFLIPFLALFILAGCNKEAPDLSIANSYSYAVHAEIGAAFVTINNAGGPDRLIGAQSNTSKMVELHTMTMKNGIMSMRTADAFDIPAQGQLDLKPGGDHLMLIGLTAPLKEGGTFDLTLIFEKSEPLTIPVKVGPAGKLPQIRARAKP